MIIQSINTGKRKEIQWKGNTYATGIYKSSVEGPLFLRKDGFESDHVVDRKHHGGADMAIYAYGYNHYAYWEELFPSLKLNYGFMGENLTVSNLDESSIHVGDVFGLGDAIVQVTKPRQPCFKLGIRFNDQSVISEMWNNGKCGMYFSVLKTGKTVIKDELKLIDKAKNTPSITEVFKSKRS